MRTIFGAFSFPERREALSLCCHRLGRTLPLLPFTRMHQAPIIAPYNRARCAGVSGLLHGEDAAARSGPVPLLAQPPPLLTAAAPAAAGSSPPGSRFNQEDETEMRVNTCSQLKAYPPRPPALLHIRQQQKGACLLINEIKH